MSKTCGLDSRGFIENSSLKLRKAGVRLTKARLALLKELAELNKPITARELFDRLASRKNLNKVDLVTVYRTLEVFEEFQLVHRVSPSGAYLACFHQGCESSPHILIECSNCEEISELDLPEETLAPMLWYLSDVHGFSASSNPIQISGICTICR